MYQVVKLTKCAGLICHFTLVVMVKSISYFTAWLLSRSKHIWNIPLESDSGRNLLTVFNLCVGADKLCKQRRSRSDTTERGAPSGSTLFATHPSVLVTRIDSKMELFQILDKYRKSILCASI